MLKFAGELTGIAGRHRQLTEMLTFQAHHDVLTQLPNRVLFNDRLQQALALAARTERPLAVLLVDIDRFKSVNDTYGHQIGDEVLCQVANRLRNRLRLSDTLARMGGDEFAVVLCHLSHSYDTEIVARALVEEFRSPIRIQGRDISVTVTVGAAIFPRHGSDAVTLLKNADLAMYRGKERGRNSALAFTPEMGEEIIARLEMENSLRHALPNGELRLFYQPKVTPTGKIRGLEALLRWQHPKLGLVTPSEFFALAEETGVILPIGAWVLHEAARQHRAWLAAGLPAISIAVNVSTLQFAQSDFIQTVQSALALCESAQAWLEIELTESLLMKNMRNAAEKLELLRRMNVTVAIDDFGTGYSSLAYLQRLPLDTLKINHIFFDSMQSEHGGITGQPIAGAIVSLAKSLGLEVVAEGVETEAQCDYMVEVGCDLLQGYLFSTPLDPEQIEPLLRAGFIRRSPALTHSV
jgi:diguanylate cyclase (GGDEF)-like protein